jgi:hypothetical protein
MKTLVQGHKGSKDLPLARAYNYVEWDIFPTACVFSFILQRVSSTHKTDRAVVEKRGRKSMISLRMGYIRTSHLDARCRDKRALECD